MGRSGRASPTDDGAVSPRRLPGYTVAMPEIQYREALRAAMTEEMVRDGVEKGGGKGEAYNFLGNCTPPLFHPPTA